MLKLSLLGPVLPISAARPSKCSNSGFWGQFYPYLQPGLQNAQIEASGVSFAHICGQAFKILKMSLLGTAGSIAGQEGRADS